MDSSGSRQGQVTRPMELLVYPQYYLLKNNSERRFSSSVSKKVSSKRYTPDSLTRSQQFLIMAVTEGKNIFSQTFIITKFRPNLFGSERKHEEKQKDMNDLPSLGFV